MWTPFWKTPSGASGGVQPQLQRAIPDPGRRLKEEEVRKKSGVEQLEAQCRVALAQQLELQEPYIGFLASCSSQPGFVPSPSYAPRKRNALGR